VFGCTPFAQSFQETVWLKDDDLGVQLTASIGLASYPGDAGAKEELVRCADEAQYLVKNSTRDGVAAASVGILPPL
jgi:GGDEF domain-containing protein